jgi:hypothetical protein
MIDHGVGLIVGENGPGAGASYTVSYGSRNPRSISFELSNATDHFTFRGYYSDGSTISGTINNLPAVLTRTPIGFAGDRPRGYSAVPSSAARLVS